MILDPCSMTSVNQNSMGIILVMMPSNRRRKQRWLVQQTEGCRITSCFGYTLLPSPVLCRIRRPALRPQQRESNHSAHPAPLWSFSPNPPMIHHHLSILPSARAHPSPPVVSNHDTEDPRLDEATASPHLPLLPLTGQSESSV